MVEEVAEHGALVGTNAAGQCLLKLVLLLPQTLLGQLTESDRIVLALDQPLQHGPAAGPHDVAGHVTQLMLAPSSTFWIRCTSCARCSITVRR